MISQEPGFEIDQATLSEPSGPPYIRRQIRRRNVIAGVAGMGLAGALGIREVMAQDEVEDDDEGDDDALEDREVFKHPEFGEQYQNFVAKLATALGETDPAVVDTAIRDALKSIVDEQFDAGEISRNLATELKDAIDSSEAPLMAAGVGGMGMMRVERIRKRRRNRRKDEIEDAGDDFSESDSETCDATPTP